LGGYTRILKLGFRHGDNSPLSLIQFVGEEKLKLSPKKAKIAGKKKKEDLGKPVGDVVDKAESK
jgi:large subunit ribosomal protein L17